jgi:two-component system, LytTR family, response regulator LytT
MKIVIIEDEPLNAERLCNMTLQLLPHAEITAMLETVADSVAWLQSNPSPTVILMDVRLADGLCFEIFDQVQITAPVIFTTAYDEYAIRAFRFNGIDYLTKPIEKAELQRALEKITPRDEAIQQLLEYVKKKEIEYRTRFLLPYKDGYRTLLVDDVDFIYYAFNATHLVLSDKSETAISLTMDELETQLDPRRFFRANRQHIISVNSIEGVFNHFNNKLKVVLKRDREREILISKEKVPVFKQWLDR